MEWKIVSIADYQKYLGLAEAGKLKGRVEQGVRFKPWNVCSVDRERLQAMDKAGIQYKISDGTEWWARRETF